MSDIFFEIFKNENDHFRWKNHIEFVKRNSELNERLRNQAIDALTFFQNEFGKGFIKNNYYQNHPIVSSIQNKSPWSLNWLVNLHSSLKYYKQADCNYGKMIKKLCSPRFCTDEGIPFIEIADAFRRNECDVTFEPKVSSSKKPDLEIHDTTSGERIFVEVSMLNRSTLRNHNGKLYHSIIDQFVMFPPSLPFTGKMFQTFSFEELNSICREIHAKKQVAFENKRMESYGSDFVEFHVAHPDRFDELKILAGEKNFSINNVRSLPLVFDEFERIRSNKIKEEAKQIPHNFFGIIYFIIEPTYTLGHDPIDDIVKIQEKLRGFPNIVGISIQSELLNSGEDVRIYEADILFRRKILWDALQRDTFFIINKEAASQISSLMLSKIIKMFD